MNPPLAASHDSDSVMPRSDRGSGGLGALARGAGWAAAPGLVLSTDSEPRLSVSAAGGPDSARDPGRRGATGTQATVAVVLTQSVPRRVTAAGAGPRWHWPERHAGVTVTAPPRRRR